MFVTETATKKSAVITIRYKVNSADSDEASSHIPQGEMIYIILNKINSNLNNYNNLIKKNKKQIY